MSTPTSHPIRTAALFAALAAGGLPLALNEWHRFAQRRADDARAVQFAGVAELARQNGDLEVAVSAFAEAVSHSPGQSMFRDRLLDTQVEQLLAGTSKLSARASNRVSAELAAALAGAQAGEARYMLALGRVFQLRDLPDMARVQYQKVVDKTPDNAQAQLFLGDAWLKAGKYEEAAVALDRASKLDPKNMETKFALGQARLFQDKFEEAATLLTEASVALARNAGLFRSLGKAQVRLKKYPEAIASMERALTLDRSLEGVHGLLGEAYANAGKVEAAIGALRVAWEKQQDLGAYRNLGRVLLQVGRHMEAVPVFKTLAALDATDPEPLVALSMAAQVAGDFDSAAAALQRAEELVTKSENPTVVQEWKKVVEQRKAGLVQAMAEARGGKKPAPPKKG